ncbi:MAG TPA: symmetrical bis(5'-nucleosyl)-tetraphosphatase [Oleiagrimonas sp.]|nr:symmetrical bis(5'-nucleosyl)-tetraphosphatase [Oleiagrimonas sp.]
MAVYAIGDVQGCYPELQRLLDRLNFDPAVDQLWFCGDLVNRGGQSLDTLRLIHSLRESCVITLGNHDLSLLAVAERPRQAQERVNPELREVLFAEDRDLLLDWLRGQKLLHHNPDLGWVMVHAGLAPRWTLRQAEHAAADVERELAGPGRHRLLSHLFGDRPATWSARLTGIDRSRATINVLTRMRYCDTRGRIDFDAKGVPGSQKAGLYPWFAVPGMRQRGVRVACGHWSALGLFAGLGVYALDTGCVWGGRLTAMRLDTPDPAYITVDAEPHRHKPAEKPRKRTRRGRRRKPGSKPSGNTPAE